MKTQFTIHQLKLHVYLGYPELERSQKQSVTLDIIIEPIKPPQGCYSDQLVDTVCYDALITHIKKITEKPFHLLEHFTYEVFKLIKNKFTASAKVMVQVTKKPYIPGLQGGVTFTYGDP